MVQTFPNSLRSLLLIKVLTKQLWIFPMLPRQLLWSGPLYFRIYWFQKLSQIKSTLTSLILISALSAMVLIKSGSNPIISFPTLMKDIGGNVASVATMKASAFSSPLRRQPVKGKERNIAIIKKTGKIINLVFMNLEYIRDRKQNVNRISNEWLELFFFSVLKRKFKKSPIRKLNLISGIASKKINTS